MGMTSPKGRLHLTAKLQGSVQHANLDRVICPGQPWLLLLSRWLPLQGGVGSPLTVLLNGKEGDSMINRM